MQFAVRLVYGKGRLSHLEFHLFADLSLAEVGNGGFGLCRPHLVEAFTPVPDGNLQGYAHVPHAAETRFKAVGECGICGHVSAGKGKLWQHGGTFYAHLLVVDVRGELQLP